MILFGIDTCSTRLESAVAFIGQYKQNSGSRLLREHRVTLPHSRALTVKRLAASSVIVAHLVSSKTKWEHEIVKSINALVH